MRKKLIRFKQAIFCTLMVLLYHPFAFAYAPAYDDGHLSGKDHFYKLVTGGFGTLVIVVMGLGGLATLVMTRQGQKGRNVPVMGVVMLLIAAFFFGLRVAVRAGMLGHEYLEW